MRNASGNNYRNRSFIVDEVMGKIPRSTKRITSFISVLFPFLAYVKCCCLCLPVCLSFCQFCLACWANSIADQSCLLCVCECVCACVCVCVCVCVLTRVQKSSPLQVETFNLALGSPHSSRHFPPDNLPPNISLTIRWTCPSQLTFLSGDRASQPMGCLLYVMRWLN